MANRRLANSIAKKLSGIDEKIHREWMKDNPNQERIEVLEQQKMTLVKDAKNRGLKLINIQVADGNCIYWETNRTTKLSTFEWLYGGADMYVSGFGEIVAVPVGEANKLIGRFKPEYAT